MRTLRSLSVLVLPLVAAVIAVAAGLLVTP